MSWKGDLIKAGIHSDGRDVIIKEGHLQLMGRSETPGTTAVRAFLHDNSGDIFLASGTSVPSSETGFAKGCLFVKTDAASGTKGIYENQGTTTSCSFNLVGAITGGEITLPNTQMLVGNASGVGAAVAISGDITISNAGVVTIGAGKVLESMIAVPTADGLNAHRVARATYDFSVDGGAISTIGLGVTIPDNAIITRSWYEVLTTLTSATDSATVALTIPTDDVGGILAAVAISDAGNPWDAGFHEGIQTGTAANFSNKTTAARELSMTIAVEALTAGKFILFAEYVVSD